MKLKTFTEHDWDGFAGAEKFKDGSNPLIGSDCKALVIADRDGIYVWLDEDENAMGWALDLKTATKRAILIVAENLPDPLTEKDLEELGFERV
jgi:hypothetical protein